MPRWTLVVAALPLGGAVACGDAAPDGNNPLAQLTAAAEQVQKAADGLTKRKPVPPVAFTELIAWIKGQNKKVFYGSGGIGSIGHILGESFKKQTGLNIEHVGYKGSAPMITDLIAGRLSFSFDTLPQNVPHIKAGKLRPLAVTSRTRSHVAPDIPTVIEAGVPKFDMMTWTGILAPAKTPPEITARIGAEVRRIMHQPETRNFLVNRGVEPAGSTPEEFTALIRSEMQKWRDLLQRTGLKLESTG